MTRYEICEITVYRIIFNCTIYRKVLIYYNLEIYYILESDTYCYMC